MLKVIFISPITAPAGIPETVIGLNTPVGRLSGIATGAVEVKVEVTGGGTFVIVSTCAVCEAPVHCTAELTGEMEAVSGFTVKVATLLKSVPEQPPA